jgi:hypothetical protein
LYVIALRVLTKISVKIRFVRDNELPIAINDYVPFDTIYTSFDGFSEAFYGVFGHHSPASTMPHNHNGILRK